MDPFDLPTDPSCWRLTPAELTALWRHLTLGPVPFPLALRTPAPRRADLDALAARGLLVRGRVDPRLAGALTVLARPASWVDALGWCGPAPGDLVRVLGAAAPGGAVVARQAPGTAVDQGGDVEVEVVAPDRLAHAVVAALPPVGPGRRAPLRVEAGRSGEDGLLRSGEAGLLRSGADGPDPARAELAALVGADAVGAGQLAVSVAVPGGAPVRECGLRWLDVAGDGRSLLDAREPGTLHVGPVDADALGRTLADAAQRLLARVTDREASPLLR